MTQMYDAGAHIQSDDTLCLHRNENQFVPKDWLKNLVIDAAKKFNPTSYPDPLSEKLRTKIGELYGVSFDHVFVGNGADEVLDVLFRIARRKYNSIGLNKTTYRVYPFLAKRYEFEVADLSSAPPFCVIDSPNSLTGEVFDMAQIEAELLVWDNVYGEFVPESPDLEFVQRGGVIVRSFSKFYGLAGLRMGYCIAPKEIVAEMLREKDIFNLDGLSELIGIQALENVSIFQETLPKFLETRERFQQDVAKLGFHSPQSFSNFLWVNHPKLSPVTLNTRLHDLGILARYFEGADHIRITVPHHEDYEKVIKAFNEISRSIS